jgi:Tol biopolymer transport system component
MYGSFAPDGSRIAFQRGGHIWVVNSDGTNEHAVSASLDGEVPAWSPTGKEIAFQEWEPLPPYDPVGTGFDIYAVHPDGTGLRNITAFTGSDTAPAWSPDGRRIAFAAERDGNGELYVTNADGTGATRLTHDDGGPEMPFDGGPSWDPSSRSGATALPQSASPGALPGRRHGRLVLRCAKRQRVRHGAIVLRVRARADSVVVVHGRLFVGERFVARRAARTVHLRLRRSARARVEHARVPVAARVRVTVWGPDGVRASTSAVSALR